MTHAAAGPSRRTGLRLVAEDATTGDVLCGLPARSLLVERSSRLLDAPVTSDSADGCNKLLVTDGSLLLVVS